MYAKVFEKDSRVVVNIIDDDAYVIYNEDEDLIDDGDDMPTTVAELLQKGHGYWHCQGYHDDHLNHRSWKLVATVDVNDQSEWVITPSVNKDGTIKASPKNWRILGITEGTK